MTPNNAPHPMWSTEAFVQMKPLARLLLIGLIRDSGPEGEIPWTPLTLKMRYLPGDNCNIANLMNALQDEGYAETFAFADPSNNGETRTRLGGDALAWAHADRWQAPTVYAVKTGIKAFDDLARKPIKKWPPHTEPSASHDNVDDFPIPEEMRGRTAADYARAVPYNEEFVQALTDAPDNVADSHDIALHDDDTTRATPAENKAPTVSPTSPDSHDNRTTLPDLGTDDTPPDSPVDPTHTTGPDGVDMRETDAYLAQMADEIDDDPDFAEVEPESGDIVDESGTMSGDDTTSPDSCEGKEGEGGKGGEGDRDETDSPDSISKNGTLGEGGLGGEPVDLSGNIVDMSGADMPPIPDKLDKRKPTERKPTEKKLDAEFDDHFWPTYPRKDGRKPAKAKYKTRRWEGTSFDDIMAGTRKYQAEQAEKKHEQPKKWRQYCLLPATFLNQDRFNDGKDEDFQTAGPDGAAVVNAETGVTAILTDDEERADRVRTFERTGMWPHSWGTKPKEDEIAAVTGKSQ